MTETLRIMDEYETAQAVADGRSLTRFNDGELNYCFRNWHHRHQRLDDGLIRRLREVFVSRLPELLIAVPRLVTEDGSDPYEHATKGVVSFWKTAGWTGFMAQHFEQRTYGSGFTSYPDRHLARGHWAEYRAIWERVWAGRHVALVGNAGDFWGTVQSGKLVESAAMLSTIATPPKDAWSAHDDIMARATCYPDHTVMLIAAGIEGTVLAHDLCKAGYQAVDIGRLLLRFQIIDAMEAGK